MPNRTATHHAQLALPLPERPAPTARTSGAPGPDAARALEAALSGAFGRPVHLVLTDNRSTMVSMGPPRAGSGLRAEPAPIVRLHRMFLDATAPVVRAIAAFLRRRDRRAGRVIDAFVLERRQLIRAREARPQRPVSLRQSGRFFHLGRVFAELNARYFAGRVEARITWGQAGKRGWRRSIKLGSYHRDERLVRIHPSLDRAFVPRFFLESVVHHEMVHAIVEAPVVRGRRRHHSAEFRRLERAFPDHRRALAWERANLRRLLQQRR